MCLLKCEVPQTARHQIIAEGELFDSYVSLLTLLTLSSETAVVYFLTVALSTCHLDVGFVPLMFSCWNFMFEQFFLWTSVHRKRLPQPDWCFGNVKDSCFSDLSSGRRAKMLSTKCTYKEVWFSPKNCWILQVPHSKRVTQKDSCISWAGFCHCSSESGEMLQLSSMTACAACVIVRMSVGAGSENLLGQCYCPLSSLSSC